MKKITIQTMLLILVLYGLHLAAHDSFALDAPHDVTNSITCNSNCHLPTSLSASWQSAPTGTPIDITYSNNLCWSCHNSVNMAGDAGLVQTHSSFQTSNKYGNWVMECKVCHYPHFQSQVTTYPTSSLNIIVTGTITSVAGNGASVTVSTALTPSFYTDYTLIPDYVNFPKIFYRITGNTANTIYINPLRPIDTLNIKSGATFAIRFFGMLGKNGQIVTPSTSGSRTVRLFNNTGPYSFASSSITVDGVCQVCHTKTNYFTNDGTKFDTGHPVPGGVDCTGCHKHEKGFKPDCDECHGFPPVANTKGGPSGLVLLSNGTSSTGSSIAGAHNTHVNSKGFACATCHVNSVGSGTFHNNGTLNVKIGFSLFGLLKGGIYDGQTTANYTPSDPATIVSKTGTRTCNNIYCHSTVQADGGVGAPTYTTPVWNGTAPCGSCHRTTAAAPGGMISTGSHTRHLLNPVLASTQCESCHIGAGNGTSYTSSNHVNYSVDVANGYTGTGTPGNGYGTCGSATACHGDWASPIWGLNVTGADMCTVCHGTQTNGTLGSSGPNMAPVIGPKVGAHQSHVITNNIARAFLCNECHVVPATIDAPGHINDSTPGVAEVVFNGTATLNSASPAYMYLSLTCNNVYCHGAKMPSSVVTGTNTTPVWTDGSYINGTASHDCAECHGYPPALSAHVTSTGHTYVGTECARCHNSVNSLGTGFTTTGLPLHINGILDVSGCNVCHGQSGPTGAPLISSDMVLPSTGTLNGPGQHPMHVTTLNFPCGTCHDKTTMPKLDSILTISFNPLNVNANIPAGGNFAGDTLNAPYSYSSNVTVTTGGGQVCSNLYCHGTWGSASSYGTDTSPQWQVASTGTCGTCHGATSNNPPQRGSHAKHVASGTLVNQMGTGPQFACTVCHLGYTANHVNGMADWAFDTSPTRSYLTGAQYRGASASSVPTSTTGVNYGACSNLYCHSSVQTATGGTLTASGYAAPTWGNNYGYSYDQLCGTCHAELGGVGHSSVTGTISTGSHFKHLSYAFTTNSGYYICSVCHKYNQSGALGNCNACHTGVPNQHADGKIDVLFASEMTGSAAMYNGSSRPGSGFSNCSNLYCHSNGTAPVTSAITVATVNWGSALPADCTGCHGGSGATGTLIATGSHAKHVGSGNLSCVNCHSATVSGTTTIANYTNHVNLKVNVQFTSLNTGGLIGGLTSTAKTPGTAYVNCSNLYCHGSTMVSPVPGSGGTNTTPAWGNAATGACGTCHAATSINPPQRGSHAKHVSSNGSGYGIGGPQLACTVCHYGYYPTTHVNGYADWAFDTSPTHSYLTGAQYRSATVGSVPTSTTGVNYGACSNLYCHSSVQTATGGTLTASGYSTPTWGVQSGGLCGTCHFELPYGVSSHINDSGVTGTVGTGSHTKHLTYNFTTGGLYGVYICSVCHKYNQAGSFKNCNSCHTSAPNQHADGKIDLLFESTITGTTAAYNGAPKAGTGFSNCSNMYCHSNGASSVSTAFVNNTVNWGAALPVDCTGCHGGSKATGAKVMATGSHGKHVGSANFPCIDCHSATVSNNTTIASYTNHVNLKVNVQFNNVNPTGLVSGRTSTAKDPGTDYVTCSNLYCHGTGNPKWGTTLACDSCHNASSLLAGKHSTHYGTIGVPTANITTNASTSVNYVFNCGACHDPGQVNHAGGQVTPNIQAAEVFFNSQYARGTTAYSAGATTAGIDLTMPYTGGNANGACTNIYCHSQGKVSPGILTGVGNDPMISGFTWTNSLPSDCTGCHGGSSATATVMASGSHTKHVQSYGYGCSLCHSLTALNNTTIADRSMHVNEYVNVAFTSLNPTGLVSGLSATAKVPGTAYVNCSNLYCHGAGVVTPTWGTSGTLTCTSCHGFPPATGAHLTHIQNPSLLTQAYGLTEVKSNGASYAFGCGNCHPSTASSHANGTYDVTLIGSGTLMSKNSSTASRIGTGGNTKCLGTYCHSNGTAAGVASSITPSWSQTFAGIGGDPCANCHLNSPTGTSAHAAHTVGLHYDDVYNNSNGKFAITGTVGSGAGHGDPNVSTTINCNLCHNQTITVSYNRRNSTCSPCHLDDTNSTKGNGSAVIASHATHVNGSVDVSFANTTVKSRAQLRDSITTVADINSNWTRINGYKTGTSYDVTQVTLNSGGTYTAASKSCSIQCHNDNTVQWTSTTVSCNSCHTDLPQ